MALRSNRVRGPVGSVTFFWYLARRMIKCFFVQTETVEIGRTICHGFRLRDIFTCMTTYPWQKLFFFFFVRKLPFDVFAVFPMDTFI